MAQTPDTADPFFREVDDAVRADRLQTFVERFGKPIVALVVAGLIGLGGWLYWGHHKTSVANENGRQFSAAVDAMAGERPRAAAAQAQKLVDEGSPNYQLLGLMTQGYAAESGNDVKTATTRYGAAAAVSGADPVLRNLALTRQTLAEFDTLPPATVVTRLADVVATDSPAFPPAAELVALAQIKQGKKTEAIALFRRIAASPFVSEGLKRRAQEMLSGMGAPVANTTSTPTATAGQGE